MKKQWIIACLAGVLTAGAQAQQSNYVSEVWVADQGNGTYKNPVLYADYSDPDVCRVGRPVSAVCPDYRFSIPKTW